MSGQDYEDLQAELIKDFLLESSEGLEGFDQDLLEIEKGESSPDLLNQVFRVVHTIKGTAGCLGFGNIESIAHTGENVLSLMRDGDLAATPMIADALLKLSDALRAILDVIQENGCDDGAGDYSDLRALLDAIKNEEAFEEDRKSEELSSNGTPESEGDEAWGLFDEEPAADSAIVQADSSGWGLFEDEGSVSGDAVEVSAEWGVFETDEQAKSTKEQRPKTVSKKKVETNKSSIVANATVRVDVDLLDSLMNMVGELVLSRNQLLQVSQKREITQAEVSAVSQRFNQVTTELQQSVMKTRMQPIGTVWGKYPRIVRDIASDLGKKVNLLTFGADTELDRTIVEAIKDPLTHIIRNAVDHGIELPEVRKAAGKPDEAQLLMRAFHEGGQVNIEIVDDGAGIDGGKVSRKAVDKGLITEEEAIRLTNRELINLIFLPGFSTAEKLSNVSGRGVGMDVVKTNIEKIGGSVDIHSVAGEGTTLRIKIPLTLAIVPALVAKSAGQCFAIPQVSLVELVRLEGDQVTGLMEKVYDSPVFRLRGNLLPLVFLDHALKIAEPKSEPAASLSIVVLRADSQLFGLVVEEVCDTEEIVVKPLGHLLKGLPAYAGATIMGDGSVAIILDSVGIAQLAGVLNTSRNETNVPSNVDAANLDGGLKDSFILFSLPGWERLAVPLDDAERLEEFDRSEIECSGKRESVLYRGGIMPLVRLSDYLGGSESSANSASEQVIVYEHNGFYVGLIVGDIRDIVEESISIQEIGSEPALAGSAIIQGKITNLVDVSSVLKAARISTPKNVA